MEKQIVIKPFEGHIHLTEETATAVLGERGITQKEFKGNSREFEANEKVTIIGPKGKIEDFPIVGPYKSNDQAELSIGDCLTLGLEDVPITENVNGNGVMLKIAGPCGSVSAACAMIACRHIHLGPDLAQQWGVSLGDVVSIEVSGVRGAILKNVRISKGAPGDAVMHIDIEESHAIGLTDCATAQVV